MSLRIPAGVRIGGTGIGGRFMSVDMVPVVVDETDDDVGLVALLELAERELDRATTKHERLEGRFQDDPRRYAHARADAEDVRIFWQQEVEHILSKLSIIEEPPEDEEPDAIEWEFGVEYLSAGGPTSNLDVNVRLRRADGLPFGVKEAVDVMAALRLNMSNGLDNPVPRGYRFASINWRSPNKGSRRWKSGGRSELDALRVVLDVAADTSAWRLGAVDR